MFQNINLGQYIPVQSILHELDPRTKIIATFILVMAVFIASLPLKLGILAVTSIILVMVSKVGISNYIEALKPFKWIIILTVILLLLLTPGEPLFNWNYIHISLAGIKAAAELIIKLVLVIIFARMLTLTTTPVAMTDGMERLMKPLSKMGFPSHELVMIITISLRFIPIFIEESQRIKRAQESRGANFASGYPWQRLPRLISILVPLMRISFQRADDLALAMESRCYQGAEGRGHLYELKITWMDYLYISSVIIMGLVISFF